ncbi:hypothetical protein BASA50_007158 [Batrachochytrium salamandrivorans]|uniref:Uncharacterized protein n=1 Tax=Batrachochytrium salamandrivorans TaxID=1357716 RepID=A0ABQ8F7U4_9FUNG|nr:hypothetical protein BASA61_005596 [Batrachochytrium salamandrivorans]KAH6593722.1 hypothetical protein BASA50_007158 [Batrachochytrium salamandrivorans]
MKFRALVVAAMVIASVNAGGRDKAMECVGRICRLGQRLSHNSPDNGPGGHNLKGHDAAKPPDCDTLFFTLKDLQTSILGLSEEYHDGRSTICELQTIMENLEDEEDSEHRASQSLAHATMEDIKLKAITLKEEHKRTWMSFLNAGCSVKFNYLLSPEEIGGLGVFTSDETESSDCRRDQETSV